MRAVFILFRKLGLRAEFAKKHLELSSWALVVISAAYLTVLFNGPFFTRISSYIPQQYGLQLTLLLILMICNCLLLLIGAWQKIFMFWLGALLLISASCSYFINTYGIVVDKGMLMNVLETDYAETMSLLSLDFVLRVILYTVVPLFVVSAVPVRWRPVRKQLVVNITMLIVLGCILTMLAAFQISSLSPFFRNYRDVKHLALPLSPVSAAISAVKTQLHVRPIPLQAIGKDAKQIIHIPRRPRRIVLVVGETARADRFSLNGYSRQTNPKLAIRSVISFTQVTACGTATAVSLPCMFSLAGRASYDDSKIKYTENALDVLQRAGVDVRWIDNNSGCKGVCDRVPTELLTQQDNQQWCQAGQCHDRVLVENLKDVLQQSITKDQLLVLHQLGSHGPEYFRRSLPEEKLFLPECTDKQLDRCTLTEVSNAYDNSIVATDSVLNTVIEVLSSDSINDVAMLYISDHGESLGENGLFLHGMPYWMAPKEQTHIPMIFWANNDNHALAFNQECMRKQRDRPLSHDGLFDSLLGLFDVKTSVYNVTEDYFSACKQ